MNIEVVGQRVSVAPDPPQLARKVWGKGSVLLWSADGSGPSFLAVNPVQQSNALDPESELGWGLTEAARFGRAPRWFGVLPYEAQRARWERPRCSLPDGRELPLLHEHQWFRFGAVAVITDEVWVVGDDRPAVSELCRRLTGAPVAAPIASLERVDAGRIALDEQAERYRSMVSAAVELIREGDVYQINLARRLDFEARGDALSVLLRMSEIVRAPYAAAFELPNELGVISTSPELFLQTDAERQVLTVPIKGTRPRTGDAAADVRTACELERDVKERAELAMVVDVERNDVGRIAEYGSVIAETPRVLPYSTVFHRLARVRGVASENVSRRQVLEALLPSGSVTGAPKIRAMELIAQLEEHRRGLYTGALGYISHDGCVNLGMAIRCLVTREREAHYHVGGGIVIRSDPQRELEETFWKAEQVLRARPRT